MRVSVSHDSVFVSHDSVSVGHDIVYVSHDSVCVTTTFFNTVTYGRGSFSYQGAKQWNICDNFIKHAASLNDFKMVTKTWNGEQCNRSYCRVYILERM